MGKAVLIILLIAIAAFFIYKQTRPPVSDEELAVKAVEERFIAASSKFMGAASGGLAVGLDAAEAAVVEVREVRNELARLRKTLTEDKAIARADALVAKVDEFCRKNDIR
jgi:AmiR/NasT family two-component response regulator